MMFISAPIPHGHPWLAFIQAKSEFFFPFFRTAKKGGEKKRKKLRSKTKKQFPYRLIGKLTASLQLQEFCQRYQIVDSTTTAARLSLPS
jgi:hypothetical protein